MTNRLLNLSYDPDLLFLDYILNNTYATINNFVEASRTGVYSWELQADFFTRLDTYLKELQSGLGDNKDITNSLKKLVALAYSVTGNGNYLLQKGIDLLPS